jgi:serine/threonine protein kinase
MGGKTIHLNCASHLAATSNVNPPGRSTRSSHKDKKGIQMPNLKFQTAFDSYKGGRRLGSGGTGFVVEAATSAGEPVAIKVFKPSHARHAADTRFRNEIRFGEQTSH